MHRSLLPFVAGSICLTALIATARARGAAGDPLPEEFASIDDSIRFVPSTQPEQPAPQHPPEATTQNVDTGRPVHEWQRLTDDWGGLRPRLEDHGIALNGSFTSDLFQNLRGGVSTRDPDFIHLTNVNLTLDTERLWGLHGGTFFINAQHSGGDDPSSNIGDVQHVSSIAADRRDQISEVWYEQTFGENDTFRMKLGKIDANTEFDNSDVAGAFLNASSSLSPTLPGLPTYPDPAFGGLVEAKLGEHVYVRGGVFDGSAVEGKTTGDDGPRSLWSGPADLFWVGEVGGQWTVDKLEGHAALGVTYHNGTFDGLNGGPHDGAGGIYFVADHQLYREQPDNDDDEQGLAVWFRAALGDADAIAMRYHLGAGLLYTGPIPGRDDDQVGIALNAVGFSPHAEELDGGDELNVELLYKVQITHYLTLTPDLQYVHNVGGDASLDDAVAAGVRLDVQF